jgi:phage tail P2-like protein
MTAPMLLPPNASALERAIDVTGARAFDLPVALRDLWNPSTCPVDLLPYLAWGLSLDSWSPDWPEAVRRERVRRAIPIQRRKGTAQSVRDVIASFGGAVAIREWWQTAPRGAPHTFALVLNVSAADGAPADAAFVDAIIAEVHRTKPVRSHFTFTQGVDARGAIRTIGVVRPVTYARLDMAA